MEVFTELLETPIVRSLANGRDLGLGEAFRMPLHRPENTIDDVCLVAVWICRHPVHVVAVQPTAVVGLDHRTDGDLVRVDCLFRVASRAEENSERKKDSVPHRSPLWLR